MALTIAELIVRVAANVQNVQSDLQMVQRELGNITDRAQTTSTAFDAVGEAAERGVDRAQEALARLNTEIEANMRRVRELQTTDPIAKLGIQFEGVTEADLQRLAQSRTLVREAEQAHNDEARAIERARQAQERYNREVEKTRAQIAELEGDRTAMLAFKFPGVASEELEGLAELKGEYKELQQGQRRLAAGQAAFNRELARTQEQIALLRGDDLAVLEFRFPGMTPEQLETLAEAREELATLNAEIREESEAWRLAEAEADRYDAALARVQAKIVLIQNDKLASVRERFPQHTDVELETLAKEEAALQNLTRIRRRYHQERLNAEKSYREMKNAGPLSMNTFFQRVSGNTLPGLLSAAAIKLSEAVL